MDMRPIYIVEGEGFRKLMKKMEPGYTVPKRSSILDAMSLKYSDHRDQIVTQIENSTAVSFTTDIWTTSVRMEAYMAVTCHFITREWKLCNFVLETKVMEVNHTGVNIAEQLGEVADAFAIPNYKRVAVVHDNASNMKLAAEICVLYLCLTVQVVKCYRRNVEPDLVPGCCAGLNAEDTFSFNVCEY